ncbi:hypothetical protein CR513_37116, partial [Mucuna pruriens]
MGWVKLFIDVQGVGWEVVLGGLRLDVGKGHDRLDRIRMPTRCLLTNMSNDTRWTEECWLLVNLRFGYMGASPESTHNFDRSFLDSAKSSFCISACLQGGCYEVASPRQHRLTHVSSPMHTCPRWDETLIHTIMEFHYHVRSIGMSCKLNPSFPITKKELKRLKILEIWEASNLLVVHLLIKFFYAMKESMWKRHLICHLTSNQPCKESVRIQVLIVIEKERKKERKYTIRRLIALKTIKSNFKSYSRSLLNLDHNLLLVINVIGELSKIVISIFTRLIDFVSAPILKKNICK